ncbi:lipoprotein-releasing ABC transporter permease subunit LolE [Testudinibacter sp. TR-2022]|uniref:lipoprotein-releasing ABC transporter permease subunit LolE n=1 Tax=Testudinibacter sp. TR-2022 TaxID=2585029 RepID=UPI00111A0F27|nr:lipoprotein-releasing ABC transporter permease subunit LolE [Testudinibacter sp. TR-2022]TNH04440.1 lipoprotein-releasing ABC transporter permease subunit LolE [Pasteurellaceae bacterium Phil31]TNH06070.1 lipoprotein-releasing ABC transporter permease subunit LolE [Testudinibacter sp. TR-2022]TNH07763.1 lipoprotein-releasing ABC transporter permease subunit LolE [Testudinibacter sp. TR-2022]TNH14423.1 lipoprotein-releasing ABC transporter permease subunit LolE [Testudinibacter sp. TR-2022]T
MNTPFFIAWRYQRGKQNNRLVSLISAFSTLGIALGVAVLIIGLSAMNGFERELRQRVLAVVPNIEINAYQVAAQPSEIQDWQNLAQRLASQPIVKGIAPYVGFTALIENGSRLKVAQLRGVDKTLQDGVSAMGQFVQDNRWTEFGAQSGLILGAGIARELDVKVGDSVSLLLSQVSDNMANSQPKRFRLPISGILRLDGQLDHSFALLPIEIARDYLGMTAQQASGIEIALHDPFQVNQMDYSGLIDYPQQLTATSWLGKFGYMYRDIQMIRTVMYIAMVLVIGVACFNIVSTLIMAVKDKQGDIAIMRTLGANNGFIRRIFISYGLLSGMKGCLIGIVLGVLLALNLTDIIKAIEAILHTQILSDGIYFIDFLPSELHWTDIGLVLLSALILSLLASLYPAARAAKLQPAAVLSSY